MTFNDLLYGGSKWSPAAHVRFKAETGDGTVSDPDGFTNDPYLASLPPAPVPVNAPVISPLPVGDVAPIPNSTARSITAGGKGSTGSPSLGGKGSTSEPLPDEPVIDDGYDTFPRYNIPPQTPPLANYQLGFDPANFRRG